MEGQVYSVASPAANDKSLPIRIPPGQMQLHNELAPARKQVLTDYLFFGLAILMRKEQRLLPS